MKLRNGLILVLAMLFAGGTLADHHGSVPPGFQPLFNGKDLSGWWGATTEDPRAYMSMSAEDFAKKKKGSLKDIHEHWSVQDGVLVNDGHGLYLTTDKFYGDFELLIDYKTVPTADSGIYLRGQPQVQIWDSTQDDPNGLGKALGSGGLWNNPKGWSGKDPLVLADNPLGQWNKFRIIMVGEYVTVYLNGKLVVDHARMNHFFDRQAPDATRTPIPATGPIQLQTHGGEIQWRNLYIREIKAKEGNAILRNGSIASNGQFTRIFNGENLNGWTGVIENYEVSDGAIMCKAGHGGNLLTNKQYGDFTAMLEFQLPPAGNNGLAIRSPAEGNPSIDAMCELQVLDSEHEKYAKLDARQYHGSAYGMVPAHRGYLRPTGQWNFQLVTVQGSTIIVELNGNRILNADLSKVTEFMGGKPHPGMSRTTGHFGFAGHNDPVKFRELYLQELQ